MSRLVDAKASNCPRRLAIECAHLGKRRAKIARRWQNPRVLGATALHSELKRAVHQLFQESLSRTVGVLDNAIEIDRARVMMLQVRLHVASAELGRRWTEV